MWYVCWVCWRESQTHREWVGYVGFWVRENKQKGRKGERDVGGKKIGNEDGEAGGKEKGIEKEEWKEGRKKERSKKEKGEGKGKGERGSEGREMTWPAEPTLSSHTWPASQRRREDRTPSHPASPAVSGRGWPRLHLGRARGGGRVHLAWGPLWFSIPPTSVRWPNGWRSHPLPSPPHGTIALSLGTQPCRPCDPHAPAHLYFPLDSEIWEGRGHILGTILFPTMPSALCLRGVMMFL